MAKSDRYFSRKLKDGRYVIQDCYEDDICQITIYKDGKVTFYKSFQKIWKENFYYSVINKGKKITLKEFYK